LTQVNLAETNAMADYEKIEADRRRWPRLVAAAALILLPLLYFFPAVMGWVTLVPGDGLTQNLGVRILIGQMIARGQIPLWNPYIFAGTPLLASIYPGALYPPNWLFALFTPTTAMNLVVITTYHLTAIGTYLYARCIGMTRVGALLAGLSFSLGGFMMAHLGHTSRIAAAAWLPWILLAIEQLYRRLRWRWVSLGALFIALQLFAGEPQMNFYAILVCGAYWMYSVRVREAGERRLRFVFGTAAMVLCGLLLSMIQLLPDRELLGLGDRAGITYDYFSGYSFPPANIFTFIFPFFFGGATIAPFKVSYWGRTTIDETCGYFGLAMVLLALVALAGSTRRSLPRFWGATALVALVLSFGGFLPFELNHVLHHVPVYNLFRAPGRHMYEFTYALSVLGGWGATVLARSNRDAAGRALRAGAVAFGALLAATMVAYRFSGQALAGEVARPAAADSLANAEALVPIAFAALSLFFAWMFARRPGPLTGALLVLLLFADLAVFAVGYNYVWKEFVTGAAARLQDPPAVRLIKSREADLNTFRTASVSRSLFGNRYDELNGPNVSIARGLQSVNGYDAMRLPGPAAVAGDMTIEGAVTDARVLGDAHQGFNLLNVKYLLRERPSPEDPEQMLELDGLRFQKDGSGFDLGPGMRTSVQVNRVQATELAVVSTMGNAVHLADGTPVVRVRMQATDGRTFTHEIQAGRDTAEWAYEREDVRTAIKHRMPRAIESWPADGFQGHRFIAHYPIERAAIERLDFEYLLPDAGILLARVSLFDRESGVSMPLDLVSFSPERWRRLELAGEVELYENLRARPRAWFVRRAALQPAAEVLETIRTGVLKDGAPFDPAETVLFQREDFGARAPVPPAIAEPLNAAVNVVRYEPNRVELQTRNDRDGFLVLSEVWYRGWEAWVDGRRVPVEKVNYALRGVAVPAGAHKIEFVFRAHSFRNGAAYTLLGLLLLLAGAAAGRWGAARALAPIESKAESAAARIGDRIGNGLNSVLAALRGRLRRANGSRWLIFVAIAPLLGYGIYLARHASYAVGGSDSSGYARIAQSLLNGPLVQPVTELGSLDLPQEFIRGFVPLGYDLGPRAGTMTPFYPVGLPLHMAAAALVAGWEKGPFLVSPLAAMLSLVLIYLVARELGLSRGAAVAGAAVMGVGVTFLFMALVPMSDVLATCWTLAAVWASLRSRKTAGWAVAAGAAFGVAVLIRPTGILILPALLCCLPLKPRAWLYFVLGGLPMAAAQLAYNAAAYGHPFQTGYQKIGLHQELRATGASARLRHYVYWLGMTLSPFVLLGWAGVAFVRRVDGRVRAMLLAWFGAYLVFYCCYDVYNVWWYTRFLLPGIPALILGALLTGRAALSRLAARAGEDRRSIIQWSAAALLLAVVLQYEWHYVRQFNVFITAEVEAHLPAACRRADRTLPADAMIVSMELSGALKFYTRRPILRWDLVAPEHWSTIKTRAAEKGMKWYALLMPHEVDDARKRLGGAWSEMAKEGPVSLWRIEADEAKSLTANH
jgi:Bacterial membrane protein YfhO/Dolichyl-phosphate-mannose-protein mannosyltransferase